MPDKYIASVLSTVLQCPLINSSPMFHNESWKGDEAQLIISPGSHAEHDIKAGIQYEK